jgi:hypothetical protein
MCIHNSLELLQQLNSEPTCRYGCPHSIGHAPASGDEKDSIVARSSLPEEHEQQHGGCESHTKQYYDKTRDKLEQTAVDNAHGGTADTKDDKSEPNLIRTKALGDVELQMCV